MITLVQAKTISEIIQSIGIGLGALLGGAGGLKLFWEWLGERQTRKQYRQLKRKTLKLYPKASLGDTFKLLRHHFAKDHKDDEEVLVLGRSDAIYIGDMRTMTKHWIVNPETFTILGFNLDQVQGASKSELSSYKDGDEINLKPDDFFV